jgi:transcriptional regulator with XRE-family HTH domain
MIPGMTSNPLINETYPIDEDHASDFGPLEEILKRARELEGLSIRELARRSGISAAQISRIESGGVTPSMETLAKLAVALDRPPEPLFIFAGYRGLADPAQALAEIRRLLEELPPGGAFGLGQRLYEFNASEDQIAQLEADVRFLEAKAAAELQRLDHLRAELALATRQAEDATDLAGKSHDPKHAQRADEAAKRAHTIFSGIAEAEGRVTDAKKAVDDGRRELAIKRDELDSEIFGCAERLFTLASGESLARVRQRTSPDGWVDIAASAAIDAARADRIPERGSAAPTPDTRELLDAWDRLTKPRRKRVLEFIEDQRRLSAQERATTGEEGGGVDMPSDDEPE